MGYDIQITKSVIAEIDQSVEWYESKEERLGDKFHNEIRSKISRIKENPKLFKEVGINHRRAVLGSSFPYTVHYLINDKTKTVKIIGLFHNSRNIELENEKTKIRKIHELKKEKSKTLNKRLNQLDEIRKEKGIDKSRDLGLDI